VKKYMMTGLVILLPVAVTFWIIVTIINWLTEPFLGVTKQVLLFMGIANRAFLFLSAEDVLLITSKLFILVLLFLVITLIGIVGRYVAVRSLIRLGDALIHRIPLISSVYKTVQELIHTVFVSDSRAFKQVVLVPFPHEGCLSLGLLSREASADSDMLPVFIPTTPNPTSGYLIMFPRSQVVRLTMSVEEGFRYIISCGVLVSDPSQFMAEMVAKKE